MESGNFMDKELDKRFIYKKSNKISENGGEIPEGFIPKLITKSITIDNITLEPGTYYEYINPIQSLTLIVGGSSLFPIIVWFKTGASLPNINFNKSTTLEEPGISYFGLLITDFDLQPNKSYELSIINNRISIQEFNKI